jgi:predicted MPP superfamily phosphohydrolase
MKTNFSEIFVYAPFAILALTFFTFVLRSRLHWFLQTLWTLFLTLAFSKFWCFRKFGGHTFYPEFPAWLIISWDVVYCGAVILSALSLIFLFRFKRKEIVLASVAWLSASIGVWCGVKPPTVREVELDFADLPASLDGYRIVQISDLHCSSAARRWRTEAVVEAANRLEADLICLTGDYVDGYVADRAVDLEPLKFLTARDGVYCVTGNHEYYRDCKKWSKWYKENGMRFLVNECVFPRPGFCLGGVNDYDAGRFRQALPDVRKAFAAATNGEFRVLLQHRPKDAQVNISEVGVDLQLSGHTHGGVAPGISLIVSKHNSGYSRGGYRYGEGVLYVSPGAGQWAGFPSRFFNPSEITLFKLSRRKQMKK